MRRRWRKVICRVEGAGDCGTAVVDQARYVRCYAGLSINCYVGLESDGVVHGSGPACRTTADFQVKYSMDALSDPSWCRFF